MKTVSMESHDFNKVNLVTLKSGGDQYQCTVCGCKGIRKDITPTVTLTELEYKKSTKCSYYQLEVHKRKRPNKVLIDDIGTVASCGIYDVVDCPVEHRDKYANDVWIISDTRHEPVRILPNEIVDVEY